MAWADASLGDLAGTLADLGRRAGIAWLSDLAALVPPVRGLRRGRRAALRVGAGGWTVARRGAPAVPAPHDPADLRRLLGPGPADVVVEAGLGLIKTVTVPSAAAAHLRRVVGFDMDRETPFTAEAVHFDARIAARHGDRLTVDLAVVPRAATDPALAALARAGIRIGRLVLAPPFGISAGGAGPERVIPVGADAALEAPRRVRGARLLPAALLVLAVLPWAIEHQRDAALAEALEQARADAAEAARLRRDLARRGGMSALDREKAGQPSVTELLAAVTDLLPDDAWLDGLRIDAGRVRISGYAASAAALIGRFETADRFANVRFQAATVRVPERGRERFQLAMDLRRPAGPDAARNTAEARSTPEARNASEARNSSETRSAGP